jgi:hypothetical protein
MNTSFAIPTVRVIEQNKSLHKKRHAKERQPFMFPIDTFEQVAFFVLLFAIIVWRNQVHWRGVPLQRVLALLGAWVMVALLILLAYKITR